MDFLRRYFLKNEPLISCPFLSSKLDSPVIKTLERHFFTLCKCLFDVLITGESNLNERNGQLIRGSFLNFKEITTQRINNLETWNKFHLAKLACKSFNFLFSKPSCTIQTVALDFCFLSWLHNFHFVKIDFWHFLRPPPFQFWDNRRKSHTWCLFFRGCDLNLWHLSKCMYTRNMVL